MEMDFNHNELYNMPLTTYRSFYAQKLIDAKKKANDDQKIITKKLKLDIYYCWKKS